MNFLWKALKVGLTTLLILITHIFIINFLPFPFNHINIIFSFLLLLLTTLSDKKIIWLSLIVSYFSEVFSAIPFGIGIAATIISLLLINWFQLNILTDRSGYMMMLSLILGITLYRTIFLIFLVLNNYFFHQTSLPYKEIVIDAGWEILLSSLVLFFLYSIWTRFFKNLRSARINKNIIYG